MQLSRSREKEIELWYDVTVYENRLSTNESGEVNEIKKYRNNEKKLSAGSDIEE